MTRGGSRENGPPHQRVEVARKRVQRGPHLVLEERAVARHAEDRRVGRDPDHQITKLPVAELELALDLMEIAIWALRQRAERGLMAARERALDLQESLLSVDVGDLCGD